MKRSETHTFLLRCLVVALLPFPLAGQSSSQDQTVQELRRQLDALRSQMEAQAKIMNQLQDRIDELEKSAKPAAGPNVAGTVSEAQSNTPPAQSTGQVGAATTAYQTFSEDSLAAARVDNAPLDPRYPGFFRLPGTSTFLKIGGYFKTDLLYDGKPAGDPERFIPSSFPVGVPSVNNATVSIRPSRMSLDFRIPVAALGDARFFVEADMFGSNATTPRLRHLYTQAKNFLIGQTFSNFMDPDASPDQLDFQQPNSQVLLRNPQLRYTFKLGAKTSLAIALEKASSDIAFKTPEFSALPNAPAPDGTIRFRHEYAAGHIQLASLLRSVAAYLPNGASDQVFGWGLSLSGAQRIVGKDTLVYQVAYGAGIERYLNDESGLGEDAAVVSDTQRYLRALPTVAPYFGYQHWWLPKVRSNIIYGFTQINNTAYQPGSSYHKSHYMAGNLIWNVFGSLNVGTEFLYGWAVRKDNSSANAPRLMFSAKYDLNFVRNQ